MRKHSTVNSKSKGRMIPLTESDLLPGVALPPLKPGDFYFVFWSDIFVPKKVMKQSTRRLFAAFDALKNREVR